MPTGYTNIIDENDATFEQYVWRCARGMGALIHMRDDDMDADVRMPKPSNFYRDYLKKERAELKRLMSLSVSEAAALVDEEYEKTQEFHRQMNEDDERTNARYDAMRAKVKAWKPPTKDHRGLKEFMLEQLETGNPRYERWEPGKKQAPEDWLAAKIKAAVEDVERYEKEAAAEEKRNRERREWIEALKASVPYVRQP